jgi:hypothetical protein
MMSPEEVGILNSLSPIDESLGSFFDAPSLQELPRAPIEEILFLSAILYFTPTHWTVWINDKTYTTDATEDNTLKITKVTNDYIEIEIKDLSKKPTKLRANQSLITVGHRIIDGDARVKPKPFSL